MLELPDTSCVICDKNFHPRRRADKTCSMDCQVQWRRHLARQRSARLYEPRPLRPGTQCQSCKTPIPAPKTGPLPKWCEPCKANQEHIRARKRTAVRQCYKCHTALPNAARQPGKAVCDNCRVDPRKRRAEHEQRRRLRRYGLTQEAYDQLLLDQEGRCPGCGTDDPGTKGWCIDHCHTSGRVRALMCNRCNSVLGMVDENPATLRRLADLAEQLKKVDR